MLKHLPNPFLSAIFGSPLDQNPTDVGEINSAAFEKCRQLVADVRRHNLTQALLLFGEPGSGKTHLLSRLRQALEQDSLAGHESLFIPIRMVASPNMLWRFLRRHLTAALLRQRSDKTRALNRVIRVSREEIEDQDRNLAIVLTNLADGIHFGDSAAWLRGDDLREETLRALRISSLSDEDELEAASRRIVMMICGLAEPTPMVFCFDQLEALQSFPKDTSGFFKLGQVVSDLHDGTRNVAAFCCLQTSMTPELEAVVRGADRDRMLGRRAALQPLNRQQAHQLIQARLATVPELSGLQTIDERDLKELFAEDGTCVARKIIVRCRELFDAWLQNPAPPPEKPADVLAHKLQDLQRTPRIADAEGILRTALPTVLYLRGINPTPPPRPNSTLDAILPGQKPSALAIANQQPGIPLIRRLERIQADWQSSAAPSLLILRDARNGISVTAKRSRETVAHLESAGARIVSVAAEALSVLEAICRLLADARSGDLTHRGAAIPAATVESWLRDHMPRPVDELLDQIGGDRTVAPDNLALMLTDLLAQSKVVSLEDAALQLAATPQEVEDCASRHPSLVGFAGGNKRVLFRIVEAQAGDNRE